MSYEPTVWKNGEAPAINSENLNKIEQGIKDASENVETANKNIEAVSKNVKSVETISSRQLLSGNTSVVLTEKSLQRGILIVASSTSSTGVQVVFIDRWLNIRNITDTTNIISIETTGATNTLGTITITNVIGGYTQLFMLSTMDIYSK